MVPDNMTIKMLFLSENNTIYSVFATKTDFRYFSCQGCAVKSSADHSAKKYRTPV